MTPVIEKALQFRIDFSEGGAVYGERVLDNLNSREIELLSKFQKLSPKARLHIEILIDLLAVPTDLASKRTQHKQRQTEQGM